MAGESSSVATGPFELAVLGENAGKEKMTAIFGYAIGSTRRVILLGPWALKMARGRRGRLANRREASTWKTTTPERRRMLCPVLLALPFGVAVIQPRAAPISEAEAHELRANRGFPDWDYRSAGDQGDPTEPKASDWGRLSGRLVAVDYGERND